MLGSICPCCQFPFYRSLGKQSSVNYQQVHGINTLIEVVLEFIKITIVFIGNLRWDIAFRNTINIFRCYV